MRRCLAAAFALATALASGCATTTAERPPEIADPEPAGAGTPAVSADESLTVLKDLAGGYNKAVRSGAPGDWREVVAEALGDAYAVRARMYGPQPGAPAIKLLNPVLYVPRSGGYPRWFAASALESTDDGAERQVLLMFVRRDRSDRWRAAHRLEFKGRPPALDLDGQGYAQEVRSAAVSALAAAHAGYLSGRRPEGTATSASPTPSAASPDPPSGSPDPLPAPPDPPSGSPDPAPGFTPDAFTTRQRGLAGSATVRAGGWNKDADRFEVTGRTARALRTADGGALVWYDLRQTKTYRAAGVPVADRLPPEVRTYLGRLGGVLGDRVTATWTWLAIGYVPASGDATVLGESLYLTEASSGL